MTTQPEKNQDSSPNPKTDKKVGSGVKDGLGNDIPADAFENEAGFREDLNFLSEEDREELNTLYEKLKPKDDAAS